MVVLVTTKNNKDPIKMEALSRVLTTLVLYWQFGVSPVNYCDFDSE